MKNQVTNGFDRMSVSNLVMKCSFIISEMTTNIQYFPTPNPTLATVQASLDELQTASLAAENRDRVAIAYRNEKKDELVALLRKLGIYVNLMADGNRIIALSSGFDVAKEPLPAPPITYVEAPVIMQGTNAGELLSKVKTVTGAKTYQYLISTDSQLPLNKWTLQPSTYTKYLFKGLESAKRYYIRVAAVGVNNQTVYSEPTSFVTQ